MSTKHESLRVRKIGSEKAYEQAACLHSFIFGFKNSTLQSGTFNMVLSSSSDEFGLSLKNNNKNREIRKNKTSPSLSDAPGAVTQYFLQDLGLRLNYET